MSNSLKEYKHFIDELARRRNSVEARRVRKGIWHEEPPTDQVKYNTLLAGLSIEQRNLIAELLQQARDGGIHDVLVFLTDKKYRVSRNNIRLAWEPFGTEMYFDFIARTAGQDWPDERSTE